MERMSLKIFILFTILIVFSNKSFSQCNDTKDGTFVSKDKLTGTTIIQRIGNLQIEINESLGIKYLQKIKWIDSCSYIIYKVKVLEKGKINLPTDNYVVNLKQINDSIYVQTVIIEKYDFTFENTITKISDTIDRKYKEIMNEEKYTDSLD